MKAASDDQPGSGEALERVKANLKQTGGGSCVTDDEVASVISCVKGRKQKLLLQQPRRGAHIEYENLLEPIKQYLAQESAKFAFNCTAAVQPAKEQVEVITRAERWRDIECLTLSPPTFEALKQLPELQQLIAFTAPDILHSKERGCLHIGHVGDVWSAIKQSVGGQGQLPSSIWELLQAVPGSRQGFIVETLQRTREFGITMQLSPHLRIALAAEVAAGMLCQGLAAPPETPEHGSMLKVFAYAGLKRLEAELQEHSTLAKAAADSSHSTDSTNSSNNSSSSSSSSRPSRLQKLWAHAGSGADPQTPQQQQQEPQQLPQQQQQQQQCACTPAGGPDLLPAASKVRSWALIPHIDLQLQAPPLLLLQQAVLRAAQLCRDQQQEQDGPVPPLPGSLQQQLRQQDQDGGITLLQEVLCQLGQQQEQQDQQQEQEQDQANVMGAAWAILLDGSPVVQQLQSAFQASGSSVDGGGTHAAALGGVLQQLCDAASTLAARCLVQLVVQANKGVLQANGEALPLQALQLLAAVQQLQATAQAAASLAAAAAAAAAAAGSERADPGRDVASCARDEQRAKQLLVQQCLTLLQLVRTLEEAPAGSAAAPDPSNSTDAHTPSNIGGGTTPGCAGGGTISSSSGGGSSRGCAGGSSCSQVLSPSEFFAADGPLSSCWKLQVPLEAAGLWEGVCAAQHVDSTDQLAAAASSAATAPDTDSTHQLAATASAAASTDRRGATATAAAPWQANQEVQGLIACLVQASAISCAVQGQVSRLLGYLLQHPAFVQDFWELARIVGFQHQDGRVHMIDTLQWCCDEARVAQGGLELDAGRLLLMGQLSELVGAYVSQLRSRLCGMYGLSAYSATAWQALLGANSFVEGVEGVDDQQIGSDSDSDDGSSSLSVEQGAAAATAAGADPAQGPTSGWGSGCSSSSTGAGSSGSSGGGGGRHRGQWLQNPEHVRYLQLLVAQIVRVLGPSVKQEAEQYRQEAEGIIPKAAGKLRQAACGAAGKFAPLQKWHQQQLQRQQQAAVQAEQWWGSQERLKVAVLGATGLLKHSKLHRDNSCQAAAAAAAAGNASKSQTGGRGSKGSSSARVWPPGEHNSHPQCPLCKQEQQQQQQQQEQREPKRQVGTSSTSKGRGGSSSSCGSSSGSSSSSSGGSGVSSSGRSGGSSSSGPYAGWAVSYDDPFLWRRLMWQLLGKLSPEAQAFYSTYLAMCPHATDPAWWSRVAYSIMRCLGASAGVDVVNMLLLGGEKPKGSNAPHILSRQYSRAVNSAYLKAHHPCTPLLSKQVLLSLSPLHHQLLPPPEVAHMLPSSFAPAVGKALMQQLLQHTSVPVLAGFQHKHARLHMWHVWWHVGLRRYHWLQQQQQTMQQRAQTVGQSGEQQQQRVQQQGKQQQQQQVPGGSSSAALLSLDELYMDADARLYAVGFATRQLSVTIDSSTTACNWSHSSSRRSHSSSMAGSSNSSGGCSSSSGGSSGTSSSSSSGSSSSSNSSSGGDASSLQQHQHDAQTGAYQLLHSTALQQMVMPSLAPKNGPFVLQGNINQILSDRAKLLSKLYVVPALLAAAAPLLDSVALGPSDPLVPLQQQQRVQLICSSLGRGCIKRSQAVGFGVTAARLYVKLGDPAGAARHESRTVQRLRQVLERPTAEQWEEHQQPRGESQQQQQQQGGQQVVKQQQERKQGQHKHHSATKQEQQVQEEEQQQQQQQWSIQGAG